MLESRHFREMVKEREISLALVQMAIANPDFTEEKSDDTRHYIRKCEGKAEKWLRVIVNVRRQPPVIVTAFYDRRLRRKGYENKI